MGSANVTRAALLGRASTLEQRGRANVELVLVRNSTARHLGAVLPQADPLAAGDVDIVDTGDPTGEDGEQSVGPEIHVVEATYRAATGTLSIMLAAGAPPLTITYEQRRLAERVTGVLTTNIKLGSARFVVVEDGEETGMVPFTVVDPESMLARGTARRIDLETFLGLLAGARELPLGVGEQGGALGGVGEGEDGVVGVRGAIPWRRFLAAVSGLGRELERERDVERGLRFTLENPIRLAGLVEHLDAAYVRRRFTAADLLYALYELEREIARVRGLDSPPECAALLAAAHRSIVMRRMRLVDEAGPIVAEQMRLVTAADSML